DLDLALRWSGELGHRYDAWCRDAAARDLAETDAPAALALVRGGQGSPRGLTRLADWFSVADPGKALLFAEAAETQAGDLFQPDRSLVLAQAGAVLARLGRAERGRKLIDDAAALAAQFGNDDQAAYNRSLVAQALAPFDVERALALIKP